MKMLSLLFKWMVIFTALLLVNCASLSKNECLNADWQAIGFEDGSRGYSSVRIGDHRRACARVNVKPDFELYQRGYQTGARQYCQPQNGFKLGLRGSGFSVVCPDDMSDAFVAAHREAKEVYRVRATLHAYEKNLEQLYANLDANRAEKIDLEQQVIAGKLTKPERIEIIRRLRQLEKEKHDLRKKIKQHKQDIAQWRDNLQMLRANSHFPDLLN